MALAIAVVALASEPATAAIQGSLEAPSGYASQIGNVQGWAFTNTPGAELIQPFEVRIDGEPVMEVPCCSSRGDVQDQHPDAPLQTGFSGVLNWAREALAATEPITVSVVIRDTAGDTLVLEETVDAYAISSFPYNTSVTFSALGDAGAAAAGGSDAASMCQSSNLLETVSIGGEVFEQPRGSIQCLSMVASRGDESERCDGFVEFLWDTATQGFKQASGCDSRERWRDNRDGTATDYSTGLVWEIKTGGEGISTSVPCETEAAAPSCDDAHDVRNLYFWSDSLKRRNGSLFTVFLDQLNRGVVTDELDSLGCLAGYCDWRIPTIEELRTLFEPCSELPCSPTSIPGPMSSIGFYASSTLTADLSGVWAVRASTGVPSQVTDDTFLPAIAVRGTAYRQVGG